MFLTWQAILRQLGHLGQEAVMIDEAGIQCHQQLQNLYKSTQAAKVKFMRYTYFYVICFTGF